MSSACVDYILYHICQSFGNDVKDICEYLLNNQSCTMRQILKKFKQLQTNKITESLKTLIDINFVSFNYTENHLDSYEFDIEGFLAYKRSARFLKIIEKHYGETSRVICYCLLLCGNLSIKEIIKRSQRYSNLQGNLAKIIGIGINNLVKFGVLEGAPMFLFENRGLIDDIFVDVGKLIDHLSDDTDVEIGRKRKAIADEREKNVWNKQYCINRKVINQLCKNDIVAENARCALGNDASLVMDVFLRHLHSQNMDSYSEPMSSSLLLHKVKEIDNNFNEDNFRDCVQMLTNDRQVTYMEEVENPNGILLGYSDYEVTKEIAIKQLTELAYVNFGQSGLIVFNYLLQHPYVDESLFVSNVMLSQAQINMVLPQMINRGYASRLELSKTKQYFDEALTSLLFVDVPSLVRLEQETCYQCLRNLSVRIVYEQSREKPLLTKVYDLSVGDGATVDDDEILVVTDNDRKTLSLIRDGLARLEAAESSVVTSLVVFESYIRHQNETGIV